MGWDTTSLSVKCPRVAGQWGATPVAPGPGGSVPTSHLTWAAAPARQVGQQVVAREHAQELAQQPQVALVALPAALQLQQQLQAAAGAGQTAGRPGGLVQQEGQQLQFTLAQLPAHHLEHAVQRQHPVEVQAFVLLPARAGSLGGS